MDIAASNWGYVTGRGGRKLDYQGAVEVLGEIQALAAIRAMELAVQW